MSSADVPTDDARADQGYVPPPDPRHVSNASQSLAWLRNMRRDLGVPGAPVPKRTAGRLAGRVGAEHASTVVELIDRAAVADVVADVLRVHEVADAPGVAAAVLEALALWLLEAESE